MALQPLIAICGTTGVGKSRLAVELAPEVCGKIINADAMQVYQGLDTLTNKLSKVEQRGVEHVLMSFKRPGEQYVIGEWLRDAKREIDLAHADGKLPMVVGGTSYWIHHLLFSNSLPAQSGPSKGMSAHPASALSNVLVSLPENLSTLYDTLPASAPSAKAEPEQAFALHALLSRLDPPMASRWHWRDTRKVLRNLEIIKENGRPASQVLAEAYSSFPQSRYRALIFWLYAEPDVLNSRLERRVDDMLSLGFFDEIRSMRRSVAQLPKPPDFTTGIFQAIGKCLREFYDLMGRDGHEQDYSQALAEMKQNTVKYARRQVKWIRNKLLPTVQASRAGDGEPSNRVYLLDATDLSAWEGHVLMNARGITQAFVSDSEMPDPDTVSETARMMLSASTRPTNPMDVINSRRKTVCPLCTVDSRQPVMLEEGYEWEAHQGTSSHRRLARNRNRDTITLEVQ